MSRCPKESLQPLTQQEWQALQKSLSHCQEPIGRAGARALPHAPEPCHSTPHRLPAPAL
jgi:hypothetical protein